MRWRLTMLLLALVTLACTDYSAPPTPGHHIPFTVEGRNLPLNTPPGQNILAARSRTGLLAAYFGVATDEGDRACAGRYPGPPATNWCLSDMTRPSGTIWMFVYVPAGCGRSGRVGNVTEAAAHLYVAVNVIDEQCPPGAGTSRAATVQLITAMPSSSEALTTASVVYSALLRDQDASTDVGD